MTVTHYNQTLDPDYQSAATHHFTPEEVKWMIKLHQDERASIACQLRDNIGQVLAACKLLLEVKHPPCNEAKVLEMVGKHLQQSIVDIMHLSYQLTEKIDMQDLMAQ